LDLATKDPTGGVKNGYITPEGRLENATCKALGTPSTLEEFVLVLDGHASPRKTMQLSPDDRRDFNEQLEATVVCMPILQETPYEGRSELHNYGLLLASVDDALKTYRRMGVYSEPAGEDAFINPHLGRKDIIKIIWHSSARQLSPPGTMATILQRSNIGFGAT